MRRRYGSGSESNLFAVNGGMSCGCIQINYDLLALSWVAMYQLYLTNPSISSRTTHDAQTDIGKDGECFCTLLS